jgi:uncharacterized membrane protein
MLVAVTFPLLAARATEAFGPRVTSAAVLALGLASLALSRRAERAEQASAASGRSAWLRVLPLALPALTVASGDERFLRLVPAAIEAVLCGLFLTSLRGSSSILQQAALRLEPYAPDFIGPYCRKATAAFALLFAAQAVALALVAVKAPGADWAITSSLLVWLPTLAFTALEFLVRKAWFRHYGGAPWDRLLRAMLPPEHTARGRRSLDYIRKKRAELGMPPP